MVCYDAVGHVNAILVVLPYLARVWPYTSTLGKEGEGRGGEGKGGEGKGGEGEMQALCMCCGVGLQGSVSRKWIV